MQTPVRSLAMVFGIGLSLSAPGACTGPAHDTRPTPGSVARYPHAADRFVRLVRAQLTAPDAVAAEQAIMCEGERMSRALGDAEAFERIRSALDTAYGGASDSAALRRVSRALAGHALGTGNHVCDSLIAAADRAGPIVPVRRAFTP